MKIFFALMHSNPQLSNPQNNSNNLLKSNQFSNLKSSIISFLGMSFFLISTFLFSCSKQSTPPPVPSDKLTITSVSPNVLSPGETITLTGTGFSANKDSNLVTFNGNVATVTAAIATSLTVTVPSTLMIASTITIEVAGVSFTTVQTYPFMKSGISTGSITRISPDTATIGTTITLTGTGFSNNKDSDQITINSISASVVTATATQLTFVVPVGSALANNAVGTLSLIVKGGGLLFMASNPFTVQSTSPSNNTITSLTPSSFMAGATITIAGSGFSTTSTQNIVQFSWNSGVGSASAQGTLINGALSVTVPPGVQSGTISVKVNGTALSGSLPYTISPPPTFTDFTPSTQQIGQNITINGTSFSSQANQNQVIFTGLVTPVSGSVSSNGTSFTVTVPKGAITGKLFVTVNGVNATGAGTSSTLTIPIPANSLANIFPNPAQVGSTVQIIGSGFSPNAGDNIISFFVNSGFTPPTLPASRVNGDTLFFILPSTLNAALAPAPISVSVNGTVLKNNLPDFQILPTIVINPTSGKVGDQITVSCPYFYLNPTKIKVFINGISCTIVSTNIISNMVTVVVPSPSALVQSLLDLHRSVSDNSVSATINGIKVDIGYTNGILLPNFTYEPN